MKKLFYIVALLCVAQVSVAQEADTTVEVVAMNTVLHADPRLDILLKKSKGTGGGSGIYSGRGFRVQIYSGNDRAKATKIKVDFMRRFPHIQTYMTYVSPQFRVKVGDFKSREEAQDLYRQLSTLYNPCMIVPDIVVHRNIRTHKENDDN
ncbi:MAG: SPOR domain-containing protein [Flavipsychrobacter sp.]|nr:SPOR domain-containing protein [Flavipsychrobacter sp.]